MKILTKIIIFFLVLILIVTGIVYFMVYSTLKRSHEEYIPLIEKYSKEMEIDEELLAAFIKVESNFKPDAESNMGAVGLMQLLPDTAKWVCEKMDLEYKDGDLLDPEKNIKLGSYYYKYLFDKFKSEDLAILAYNGGLGNVQKWLDEGTITNEQESYSNIPIYETKTYLSRIKDNRELYKIVWEDVLKKTEYSQWKRSYLFIKKIILSYFD